MNKLYETAKECLGLNLAPTYKELGCVEALRNVFKKATGEELADTYSTRTLYLFLKKDTRFKEVFEPATGDLILSPTGYGNGSFVGHCGVVGENKIIYSNNSDTLLWDTKYTIDSWRERYMRKGGFPMFYYHLIEKQPVKPETPLKPQDLTNKEQLKVILEKVVKLLKQLLGIK